MISAAQPGVYSTGRLATTKHDGYQVANQAGVRTGSFTLNEGSVYASGEMNVSRFFGLNSNNEQLRIGAMAGWATAERTGGTSRGSAESGLFATTAVYSFGSTYLAGTILGAIGESSVNDLVARAGGSLRSAGDYSTTGIISSAFLGNAFAVGRATKLDLRGGLSYSHFIGDSFTTTAGLGYGGQKLNVLDGILIATLYSETTYNDIRFRPYIRGTLRQHLDYQNEVTIMQVDTGVVTSRRFSFKEGDTSGTVTLGFDAAQGNWTYGASTFYEGSSDRNTFGLQVGVKLQLQ